MRAWQFTNTNEPLVLNEVPAPTPGPGEVILDVKAAGLCHSDVGAMTDASWLAVIPVRPIVLGHEIAGVVSSLGEGVTSVQLGDRCSVWPLGATGAPGSTRDGGFTYHHRVPVDDLVPVPDQLSFELAALGTDAGMTSYHAVMTQAAVKADDKVGIIGLGGLGHIGARVAVVNGAEVHVAEVNTTAWPLAEEIGATSVVADAAEWADQGFDVIVDFAGFGSTTAHALRAIRRNGRVVLVGMGSTEIVLSSTDIIRRQAQIFGSHGGTKEDIAAVYDLFSSGAISPAYTVIAFDDIPAALMTSNTIGLRDASSHTSPTDPAAPRHRGSAACAPAPVAGPSRVHGGDVPPTHRCTFSHEEY